MSVDVVVARARAAQPAWAALSHQARGRRLLRARAQLARRAGELADVAAAETGKPTVDALYEVAAGCEMISWVVRNAARALRDQRVSARPYYLKRARVQYAPLGVIGVISPWNYPIGIPMQSLPYALGAGNTVVFKPSELAAETGRLIADCLGAAGDDVVVHAPGDGVVGAALVHAGIDKLVFTGGPATARCILSAAAEELLPVVLELGGKDAMIVCDDADLDVAAAAAVGAAFANAGQTCMASERVLVHEGVYDEFVARVVRLTENLSVGTGDDAHIGRVTRPSQLDVVEERLESAQRAGAKVLTGGHRLPEGDAWFSPAVVVDVPRDGALWREESFAPVMSIARVSSDDDAVGVANASEFGLSASVFTRDRDRAARLTRRLEVGGVNVNDAMFGSALPALPFGGEKHSGYGRLQGAEALRQFSRATSVVEPVSMRLPSFIGLMFTAKRPNRRLLERALKAIYGRS